MNIVQSVVMVENGFLVGTLLLHHGSRVAIQTLRCDWSSRTDISSCPIHTGTLLHHVLISSLWLVWSRPTMGRRKDPNIDAFQRRQIPPLSSVGSVLCSVTTTRTTPRTLVHKHRGTTTSHTTTKNPSSIFYARVCAPFENLYTHESILYHHSQWSNEKELQAQTQTQTQHGEMVARPTDPCPLGLVRIVVVVAMIQNERTILRRRMVGTTRNYKSTNQPRREWGHDRSTGVWWSSWSSVVMCTLVEWGMFRRSERDVAARSLRGPGSTPTN